MSAFTIFAIVVTICYVIYYAAIITIDMNAKPKDEVDNTETIDNGGDDSSTNLEDNNNFNDTPSYDGEGNNNNAVNEDLDTSVEWKEECCNQNNPTPSANIVEEPSEAVDNTNNDNNGNQPGTQERNVFESEEGSETTETQENEEQTPSSTTIYINKEDDTDKEKDAKTDANTESPDVETEKQNVETESDCDNDISHEEISEENISEEEPHSDENVSTEQDNPSVDEGDSAEKEDDLTETEKKSDTDTNAETNDIASHIIMDDDDDIVYEEPTKRDDTPMFEEPKPEYEVTEEYGANDVEPSETVQKANASLESIEAESKNGLMSKEYMSSLSVQDLASAVMGNLDNNIVTDIKYRNL